MAVGVIIGWTQIGRVVGILIGWILRVNVWDASLDKGVKLNIQNWCDRNDWYRVIQNWSNKHLNWSWVLAVLFVLGNLALWFVKDGFVGGLEVTLLGIAVLIVSSFVIIRKGRSLWWLLLAPVCSPLWLTNKKIESLTS